ncbi:TetR family transcriptional regulator [Novosphingobium sp. FSY-8]|uniref:TetR family transcriptional regulator n=1 Tax=Novosphingobium ovatum TaxID=1908523 RepID=A0ABW9XC64_9SPHN|nr:TetR/AcrR family transcriptional regulator [Novosphingobium ovatum]NBC36139.1 TetR family transcriptional regulator [Novosphingobium ovatum]
MPKKVDHDERRQSISDVVADIVFESGVEALTIRDIAQRVGCSPSVISHYFNSKLDMLIFTHRQVRGRAEKGLQRAIDNALSASDGFERLLPVDEPRWRDWYTWFAFWGVGPDQETMNEERIAASSDATNLFIQLVEADQRRGRINPTLSPIEVALETQTVVNGIATLVAQSPSEWPAERQIAHFRKMFARIVI